MVSPMANLFFVKSAIVLSGGVAKGVMMWMISLNQHPARQVAAARATGYLSDQLKGSFGCAKVGQCQAGIDRHNSDQRHIRKVMPLRQHLGSDQHVELAFAEVQQCLLELMPPRFGVAIDPAQTKSRSRKQMRAVIDSGLESLEKAGQDLRPITLEIDPVNMM